MERVFDLEKAKKIGCWTMDGRRARIICDDLKDDNDPIVVATVEDHEGRHKGLCLYSIDGQWRGRTITSTSELDLTTDDPRTFDLERAMANGGRCKTRGGLDARIICTDKIGDNFPIVALVLLNGERVEQAYDYTRDGRFRNKICGMDLVNI